MTPKEVLNNHIEENMVILKHLRNEIARKWKEQGQVLDRIEELKKQAKKIEVENRVFRKEIKRMEGENKDEISDTINGGTEELVVASDNDNGD